jgi:hypothetical protein
MEPVFPPDQPPKTQLQEENAVQTQSSTNKAIRTMLLALLFQISWPERLSSNQIFDQLPFYGDHPIKALYRDLATITGVLVENLPEPDDENLVDWCALRRQKRQLALTYDRHDGPTGTFGLAQSLISIDVREDEARAFVALQEGFTPGTPYAPAVQHLLQRWEWLFSENSRKLVASKRRRKARPVVLPLSPVVDYSQHEKIIQILDRALEENAYVSFSYTPPSRSWDDPPQQYFHLEPYELEYRDGHWYFTAYLSDLDTFLDFRVDRIRLDSLKGLDPDHFSPGAHRRTGVKIQYWVSPMMARHQSVSARLQDQRVEFLENDGGAIIEGYAKSI